VVDRGDRDHRDRDHHLGDRARDLRRRRRRSADHDVELELVDIVD
jgi:hypothetical protein